MTVTSTSLLRAAGIAAAGAGLIFIGVQIGHPHMDATSITTTEVVIRNSLKVLMAVLALAGITGMYLRQVRETGVLGLLGYLVLGVGYLAIASTSLIAAYLLPALARRDPGYVDAVLAVFNGRSTSGDIGLLQTVYTVQSAGYLAGGLLLGIALYRARILARWAAALLAVGGLVSITLALLPDAFYRLLAWPNGIAMIGLGWSLWRTSRTFAAMPETGTDADHVTVGVR